MRLRAVERAVADNRESEEELRAFMQEVYGRMIRVESDSKERALVHDDDIRRSWNQIALIGIIGGLALGAVLALYVMVLGGGLTWQ